MSEKRRKSVVFVIDIGVILDIDLNTEFENIVVFVLNALKIKDKDNKKYCWSVTYQEEKERKYSYCCIG